MQARNTNPYEIGDPVLDCAQGRAMVVVAAPDQTVGEWNNANSYDLHDNYANQKFGSTDGDYVVETVYVGDIRSKPSKTYTFPTSRCRLIDVHEADGDGRIAERVVRQFLERLFIGIHNDPGVDADDLAFHARQTGMISEEGVGVARELADVDARIGGNDAE